MEHTWERSRTAAKASLKMAFFKEHKNYLNPHTCNIAKKLQFLTIAGNSSCRSPLFLATRFSLPKDSDNYPTGLQPFHPYRQNPFQLKWTILLRFSMVF